ncbi:MAG TPA: DUF262 domain-containing protein [Chloroflexota bacterium]|jgi:hypothetical protein
MKAEEMRLAPLLSGHKQFVVPYFQRVYSWRSQQWNTLFDDILELYELGAGHTHFLGSMVLLAEGAGEARTPTLVIDGQQRLVTLSLFMAAIRDSARNVDPGFADELHKTYLVNPDADDEQQLKVLCTQQDRPAFATVVQHAKEPPPSPIRDAYRTFREALDKHLQHGFDLEQLVKILVTQLSFVAITLDAEDNPYRIFESLNAKGMPLTQGDLLRNYFFMRLPPAEHERWYNTVWWPMQRRLGERFDAFMRDFLLKDGDAVRPDEVYQEWRKRLGPLDEDDIRAILHELAAWSLEYDQILHPERETDAGVRQQLSWLTAWSRTLQQSIDPLLMRIHSDYRKTTLSAAQAQQIFTALSSFLVRRAFASTPAIEENQLLIGLYNDAASDADAFVQALSRPQVGWPSDADFAEGVLRYPLYFGSHPDRRKLILQALEDSFTHRMPIRYEQIELQLITPLLPRADWLAEVGVGENEYWKVIGTLGNLTWVPKGRMPDLGVPERKKELLRMTRYGLELVRDFAQVERWSAQEIEARSKRLAERALEIWPGPKR